MMNIRLEMGTLCQHLLATKAPRHQGSQSAIKGLCASFVPLCLRGKMSVSLSFPAVWMMNSILRFLFLIVLVSTFSCTDLEEDTSGALTLNEYFQSEEVFPYFSLHVYTLHPAQQSTFNFSTPLWSFIGAQEAFFNSFEEEDVRKGSFIYGPQYEGDGQTPLLDPVVEPNDPDGPPVNLTPEIGGLLNQIRQNGARIGKFEFALGAGFGLNNDFPIFRYADILLMKAEALWRLDNASPEALQLVNLIRERAKVEAFTELTAENLLAERGREFFAEAWRRNDLIRFGKFNEPWWEKSLDPDDHVNIFPIPNSQLLVNPNLVQNPGY